jgi:hypothetical protein
MRKHFPDEVLGDLAREASPEIAGGALSGIAETERAESVHLKSDREIGPMRN